MLIEADLHVHTLASSHAYSTVNENAEAAYLTDIRAIALTDHAPSMPDSPHCWHFENFRVLPRNIKGVTLLFGVEANIMDTDGKIDITDLNFGHLDWVVASIHGEMFHPSTVSEHTQAYVGAIKNNPQIDLLGHPTNTRYQFDIETVVKAAKEYGKIVELNESHLHFYANKKTISFAVEIVEACKKYETLIAVNSDAHYHSKIGNYPLSAQLIRDTNFPRKLLFNAELDTVLDHIRTKHPNAKRSVDN